ncbi:unnamed protein product [Arctia plantaginis]|uniref:trypsin n=1 Tax=Arctia plantaginis TaxID=874455 RepID=A0A8S0ZK56_ARCPL|nr:unnamed protein product [Arctia plantaginis]
MLCVTLILIAVVSCGARELRDESNAEQFRISKVSIESLKPNDSRVIGGSPTTIETYPFMVQILNNERFSCGGSILTTQHVLSAAHCFFARNGTFLGADPFSIRAGTSYLDGEGTVISVSRVVAHESYNNTTYDNDVAVLFLSSNLQLSASVQSVSIPFQGETLPFNSRVVTVGWGRTVVGGVASNVLRQVPVLTVNRAVCYERYQAYANLFNAPWSINDNMICAGLLDIGGADACQGDSGGPLVHNGIVVGVTSWGLGCALPLYPGVYAKVSRYSNWIDDLVLPNASTRSQAGVIAGLLPLVFVVLKR